MFILKEENLQKVEEIYIIKREENGEKTKKRPNLAVRGVKPVIGEEAAHHFHQLNQNIFDVFRCFY